MEATTDYGIVTEVDTFSFSAKEKRAFSSFGLWNGRKYGWVWRQEQSLWAEGMAPVPFTEDKSGHAALYQHREITDDPCAGVGADIRPWDTKRK